ncbi:MAG TPA: PIN domain-containing protein [Pirellulales bacterium]|jgi:predicted nucleic acid-binding protein|nr:PIN domain-containing protein [Pirellulales bacterium]
MILLDTSALVAAYGLKPPRGHGPSAVAALRHMIKSGMSLGIPAIVLQEVLAGVRDKTQFHELQTHFSAFRIVPATVEDHIRAAQLAVECAANRVACSTSAALIVAQAARGGWHIFSVDPALAAVARAVNVGLAPTRETASERRRGD